MTIAEQIQEEIARKRSSRDPKPASKQEKKQPTKEEREAYRQRMIEKEEREALKRMGQAAGKPAREKQAEKPKPAMSKTGAKADTVLAKTATQQSAKQKPAQASKPNPKPKPVTNRPKQLKTIELPNGDSLVIFYVPGGQQ